MGGGHQHEGITVSQNRSPRHPVIHFSIVLQHQPTRCGSCDDLVYPGLIGWYQGKANGPLCLSCLLENDPDLGSVLAAVQLVRETGATLQEDDPTTRHEAERLLTTFARRYEAFAVKRWPRHPLNFLDALRTAYGSYGEQDIN